MMLKVEIRSVIMCLMKHYIYSTTLIHATIPATSMQDFAFNILNFNIKGGL